VSGTTCFSFSANVPSNSCSRKGDIPLRLHHSLSQQSHTLHAKTTSGNLRLLQGLYSAFFLFLYMILARPRDNSSIGVHAINGTKHSSESMDFSVELFDSFKIVFCLHSYIPVFMGVHFANWFVEHNSALTSHCFWTFENDL
jgi:hypothetical protein